MPWKLIVFLVVAIILALFIGFNLENKCEISFVFGKIDSVPVYLTILISFAAGLIVALPFAFKRKLKKDKKAIQPPGSDAQKAGNGESGMKAGEEAPDAAANDGEKRKTEASGKQDKKKRNADRKKRA